MHMWEYVVLWQWKVMLANLLVDVNGRVFLSVKVVDVSQLLTALRAERRSDSSMQLELTCSGWWSGIFC